MSSGNTPYRQRLRRRRSGTEFYARNTGVAEVLEQERFNDRIARWSAGVTHGSLSDDEANLDGTMQPEQVSQAEQSERPETEEDPAHDQQSSDEKREGHRRHAELDRKRRDRRQEYAKARSGRWSSLSSAAAKVRRGLSKLSPGSSSKNTKGNDKSTLPTTQHTGYTTENQSLRDDGVSATGAQR